MNIFFGIDISKSKEMELNTSRVIPVEETLHRVSQISKKIGITRISDITYMDKLYIPNYSCVLPGNKIIYGYIVGRVQLNNMQR